MATTEKVNEIELRPIGSNATTSTTTTTSATEANTPAACRPAAISPEVKEMKEPTTTPSPPANGITPDLGSLSSLKDAVLGKIKELFACYPDQKLPRPYLSVWIFSAVAPFLLSFLGVCFVLLIMTFYLVPFWGVTGNMGVLHVALLNADVGFGGQNLGASILASINNTDYYKWNILPPETTYDQVLNGVQDSRDYWMAIYIPKDFTQKLLLSWSGNVAPGTVYNNTIWILADEIKGYTSNNILKQTLSKILDNVDHTFRAYETQGVFGASKSTTPIGVRVNPVMYDYHSVHTIDKYGWYFSIYISFVVMWLGDLVSVNLSHIAYHKLSTDEKTAFKWWQLLLIRYSCFFILNTVNALTVSIYLESYGVPSMRDFGSNFAVLWFTGFAFSGIISALLSCFSQIGLMIIILLLIFQLVTCDGIFAIATLPPFFRVLGPVFPMHHGVRLFRYAAFHAKAFGPIGYHLAIIATWIAIAWPIDLIATRIELGKRLVSILPNQVEGIFHLARLY